MKKSVFVLVLLLLFACAQIPTDTTKQPVSTDFRFGTEALSMSFMTNMPPAKLYDRDLFNVIIRVENKGTKTLESSLNKIYLSGFDQKIITGIETTGKSLPILEGRNQFLPQGGFDMVSFTGRISSLMSRNIDKYSPMIVATACYNYETLATAQVCIDPNPYSTVSNVKVCTPASVATGSQGAPVAISSIEVNPAPGKTRFTINIQNVGGGNVFDPSSLGKCDPFSVGLSFNELDVLNVDSVMFSDIDIKTSCKPVDSRTGKVRLTNGRASLFCETTNLIGNTAYLTPLTVKLSYGYRQSISTQVEIRPSA